MSVERTQLVVWLSCCLLCLTACPKDVSGVEDESHEDAGAEEPAADGGESEPEPAAESDEPDAPKPATDPGKPKPTQEEPKPPADPSKPADKPADKPAMGDTVSRFFLPTPEPENTKLPRVLFDAKGGLHALYPGYAGADAYYAYCPNNCTDPQKMKVVALHTDGTVGDASLALTAEGAPRVLLPTYLRVYFAQCDKECTEQSSWKIGVIAEHQSERDVTGQALALDSKGRPRFVMHTYLAYLGVGQREPHTYYAQCDSGCTEAANWRIDTIQDQIFYRSTLRFDAQDRAHLTTVAADLDKGARMIAYLTCAQGCTTEADWKGIGLVPAFENDIEEIRPSIALALTKRGGPRILALGTQKNGKRGLFYFECDEQCDQDHWRATLMSDHEELGSGVDIALDAKDRTRFVFTLDDNIGLYSCDAADCTIENSPWELTKVEFAGEVPKDSIILWPNCTLDAWLLHDPSLALATDGSVRVAYQATDISGGFRTVDPTKPACVAGKDMTLSRMAVVPAAK
ncbi:MAG TPA: hypothetical protein VJV78_44890 [Polyangiales bacterium]|nr:hypothetical protein [Polyangiales bacterium]